jgi:Flp pilus assembly protein TadB
VDVGSTAAGERNQVQSPNMDTLAGRLDYLARNYLLFLGPLLLFQGVGHATSPVIVWVNTALIALLLVNKLRATWRSD